MPRGQGSPINDSATLEAEADKTGARVAHATGPGLTQMLNSGQRTATRATGYSAARAPVQCGKRKKKQNRGQKMGWGEFQQWAEDQERQARPRLDPSQARGLAMMLARRTGTTDTEALNRDVARFADRTGHNPPVEGSVPNRHFLQGEVDRYRSSVESGIDASLGGANADDLMTTIRGRATRGQGESLAASQRAAHAAVLAMEYQHVQRITDSEDDGNFSYQGRMRVAEGERPILTDIPRYSDRRFGIGNDQDLNRAAAHISGGGRRVASPYVSVTEHAPSANQTTDQGLRRIIRGTRDQPGAPNLDTFLVPWHAMVHPDTVERHSRRVHGDTNFRINYAGAIGQARQEHERLYYGDTLNYYRTHRQRNPYQRLGENEE